MPWRQVPMKDVGHCDKLSGSREQAFDPEISEWGNPLRRTRSIVG